MPRDIGTLPSGGWGVWYSGLFIQILEAFSFMAVEKNILKNNDVEDIKNNYKTIIYLYFF